MKPKGYLVFTTHDGDENDATFVPETETTLIEQLRTVRGMQAMEDAVESFNEWKDTVWTHPDYLHWSTQTYCEQEWPFNDVHVLGTFYLLVY